jgi:DNA invertase Pin-like site-specific DNA recombinase
MLLGYARVSKADGSQVLDLQKDALLAGGVTPGHIYEDRASGRRDDRPGLAACLKALREGDTLVLWKLDRLGRDLRHLVNTVHDLTARGIGLKVLTGQGAAIDTTTPAGKLVFGIFAALAEFERELISERTVAGLASARARGRKGGRPFKTSSDMPGRFHPPMEYSHDLDQIWRIALGSKVDHVALLGVAVEPLGDVRTRFPELRVVAEPVEAAHQGIDVPIGLLVAPAFGGVDPDLCEVRFRPDESR